MTYVPKRTPVLDQLGRIMQRSVERGGWRKWLIGIPLVVVWIVVATLVVVPLAAAGWFINWLHELVNRRRNKGTTQN